MLTGVGQTYELSTGLQDRHCPRLMTRQFYKSIENSGDPEDDVRNWVSVEEKQFLNMCFLSFYCAAKWDGVRDRGGDI